MGKNNTLDELILYHQDFNSDNLKTFIENLLTEDHFSVGYAIIELFNENMFHNIKDMSGISNKSMDIISARFFNNQKQVKVRRIDDDCFRVVADFLPESMDKSFNKSELCYLDKITRQIPLWGYKNNELKRMLYEERIPFIFEYPVKHSDIEAFHEKDRVGVFVSNYHDHRGKSVWDKITAVGKWQPT